MPSMLRSDKPIDMMPICGNVLLTNPRATSTTSIVTNTGSARDIELLITTNNQTGGKVGGKIVDINSNAKFMGAIYAPNAKIKLPSNFVVYGAVKAAFVEMASNGLLHFDEGLLYDPNVQDIFTVVSWRRLSQVEIDSLVSEAAPIP